jgi:antiviral helicase SKI2
MARRKAGIEATGKACLECPDFLKHYAMAHDEWLIKENIVQLRQLMSDQNLQLLPDYEQRISVLKDLGFIDEDSRVELKGKVACEIHSADELVLTELILENVLAEYEPEEIVALLSAFVFQEKTDVEPTLTASLERGVAKIVEISEKVNQLQTLHQVILSADDSNDFVSKPRFGMVEVVYEWARGMSFNRITDLTDVMEGTIVRVITRLDETCREVKNAARIIGDPALFQKMGTCQELIKRYVGLHSHHPSYALAETHNGESMLTCVTGISVTAQACTCRMFHAEVSSERFGILLPRTLPRLGMLRELARLQD